MSSIVKISLQAVGHFAGQTVKLGSKWNLTDGKIDVTGSPEDVARACRALSKWSVFPEGSAELKGETNGERDIQKNSEPNGQHPVSGSVQPDGGGTPDGEPAVNGTVAADGEEGAAGVLSEGDGPAALINERLARALKKLDPKNDTHWTKDGKPAMSAVEKVYGAGDFTRADIEAASPGLVRASAKK